MIARFLFIFFSTIAYPGQIEANTFLPSDNTSKEEVKTLDQLPNPGNLQTIWWKYFSVDEKELKLRIEKVKQDYRELIDKSFESKQKENALQLVDKFIVGLESFLNIQKTVSDKTKAIEEIHFKDHYNIDDWLFFSVQLKNEMSELDNQTENLEREFKEIKAFNKELDNEKLAYMQIEANTDSKIMAGFSLMVKRVSLAIKSEEIKLDKQNRENLQSTVDQYIKFQEHISDKLTTDQKFVDQIDEKLKKNSINQVQIKDKLDLLDSQMIAYLGKSALQRAQAKLLDQQIVNLKVQEAVASINNATLNGEKDLALLILNSSLYDLNELFTRLEHSKRLLKDFDKKISELRIKTANEMSKVYTDILSSQTQKMDNIIKEINEKRIDETQETSTNLKKFDIEKVKLTTLLEELNNRIQRKSGKVGTILNWSATQIQDLKTQFITWWTQPIFSIGDTPVSALGLIRVILIIAFASIISSVFRRLLSRIAERRHVSGNTAAFYTVGRLAHYLILLVGIIVALTSIGLDFTNLALVAGALSVGIGFGLQSIVNNFVSGLILLFEGTLNVGDFIEIDSGITGMVKEINVRSTLINTNDNVDIIVPNSVLVSNRVTNWTLREANRRIHVPFGVAYGSDKEIVKKAALEAAANVRYTHKTKRGEAAQCWLVNFGDSSLDFELVVWINNEAIIRPSLVHATYMWELETSLNKYGIVIPFPQRDLHIRSSFQHPESGKGHIQL